MKTVCPSPMAFIRDVARLWLAPWRRVVFAIEGDSGCQVETTAGVVPVVARRTEVAYAYLVETQPQANGAPKGQKGVAGGVSPREASPNMVRSPEGATDGCAGRMPSQALFRPFGAPEELERPAVRGLTPPAKFFRPFGARSHGSAVLSIPVAARRPAFTLIEILATLAVLGLVLPAVMQGLTLCMATAGHARSQAQATALAQAKLGELVAAAQWDQSTWAGDWSPQWPDYHWSAQLVDWDGPVVRELTVTVNWQERGRGRDVSLTTLIYIETYE